MCSHTERTQMLGRRKSKACKALCMHDAMLQLFGIALRVDCLVQMRMARCVAAVLMAGRLDDAPPEDQDRAQLFQGLFRGFTLEQPAPAEVLPLVESVARTVLQLMQRAEADGWVNTRVPGYAGPMGQIGVG